MVLVTFIGAAKFLPIARIELVDFFLDLSSIDDASGSFVSYSRSSV